MSKYQVLLETDTCDENEEQQRNYPDEPTDKFKIVYSILYLLGIAYDLPVTFFITANNYWMYKFRDIPPNSTGSISTHGLNSLQTTFTVYLNFLANIAFPTFCLVNAFLNSRVTFKLRIISSLTIMLILFCITTGFVNINTDSWQYTFFLISLIIANIVNACTGILFSCFYGIVSKFPKSHIISFTYGQSMAKIIAAILQVVSLTIGNPIESALIYFAIGCFITFIALIGYIVLSRNPFYTYYLNKTSSTIEPELQIISRKKILRKIYPACTTLFLTLFTTYFVFPGVTVLIKSYDNNKWGELYFTPIISFLVYAVGDYFGRYLEKIVGGPREGVMLNVLGFSRLILIPLILFCNVQPRRNSRVIFKQDSYYIIFIALLGVSHGYVANSVYISVPMMVEQYEKDTASIMTTFIGTVGMVMGSICSIFVVKYI